VSFVPLSTLERCDLCHDLHALRKVHFDGRQFLCRKCRKEKCSAVSRFVPQTENLLNPPISTP
jgi:hypothetical protein